MSSVGIAVAILVVVSTLATIVLTMMSHRMTDLRQSLTFEQDQAKYWRARWHAEKHPPRAANGTFMSRDEAE